MNSRHPSTTKETELVIVLVSNGPGELNTWVKPITQKLHKCLSIKPSDPLASISLRLVLVPCPNATGNEEKDDPLGMTIMIYKRLTWLNPDKKNLPYSRLN